MKIKDLFKKKKTKLVVKNIGKIPEEELINQLDDLRKSIAEKESVIQKQQSMIRQFEDSEKQKIKNDAILEELNKQKELIRNEKYENLFSLKNFFKKYITDRNFRENLCFTTHDRAKKISNVGDICFSESRGIVLLDEKGNIVLDSQNLENLFESVAGLGNDSMVGRIPICLDSKYNFVETSLKRKLRPIDYDEEGKPKKVQTREVEFYKIINEKDQALAEAMKKLEEKELLLVDYEHKIQELNLAIRSLESRNENMTNEKVSIVKKSSIIDRELGKLQSEILDLQNVVSVQEKQNMRLEGVIEQLSEIAEREQASTEFTSKIEDLRQLVELKSGLTPKEIIKDDE